MKRTSKILILVLSLALVLGAVAMVASATASDVTLKKSANFEDKNVGLLGTASDGKNPTSGNITFQQGDRVGRVDIAEGTDGNKYAVITQTDYVAKSGPYAWLSTGGNASIGGDGKIVPGSNDFSNYKYLVYELDVMSPTGKFMSGSIDPSARAFKKGGTSRDFWNTNAHTNIVQFGNDANGSYLTSAVSTSSKMYVNPYEFTHVQIILENTTKEGDANIGLTSYVYINGEFWFSKAATNVPTSYHSDIPHTAFVEFKVNYSTVDDPTLTLAMDNVKYSTVPAGSETTVEDVLTYDADNRPAGNAIAKVGEVEYTDFQAAFDAVEDGETINILKNALTPVVINAPFANVTVNKGDYTLELVAGNGMELTNDGDVYTAIETAPKLFQYEKNGAVTYGIGTLAEAIKDADAGSTVKLLADVTIKTTTNTEFIDIGKKLTLDLNGYTIKHITEGVKTKCSLFRMTGGTDLTVTSSRFGGKIFNEGWNSATGVGCNGVFSFPNDSAILRINGNIDGKPALAIYAGCLTAAYSTAVECHIDGGMYVNVTGDMNGFIESRKVGRDSEVKNAIFYTNHNGGVFGYTGRNTAVDDYGHITVDNCVIIGHLTNAGFVAPQVMDVTNTYITGNVNVIICKDYANTVDGDKLANVPGTVILGAGTYVGGTISSNVQIADGYALHDVNVSKEFTYDTHAWKASADYTFDASSFDATSVTKSSTFKKVVGGDAVTATWKDAKGNVLGTSTVYTGTEAIAPAGLKAAGVLVEGWLDYIPGEWNESLLVPAGVTELTFTEKEGGKKVGIPAVQLLFNVKLTTHFEYHLYIPVTAEGISVTAVDLRGDRLARYQSFLKTKYTFNGEKYTMVDAWPGYTNAALENSTAGLTFTYDGITYKVATNVNMVKYSEYVLDAGNGYGETAKDLVANVANYLVAGNKILGKSGEGLNRLQALVDANKDRIISLTDAEKVIPDTSKIAAYVQSAQLISDAYGPRFRFNLTEAGKAAKITLPVTAAFAATDTEYATLGYIDTNNTAIANINNSQITVTPAEGKAVSLTFNLGNYYALLAASGATADQLAFVDAMYGYAIAGRNY